MSRKVVAFDFDGVLADESMKPLAHNIALARRVYDARHFIVVYTSRPFEDFKIIARWLAENGVLYDVLETGKLRYDWLVDDRCSNPLHPSSLRDVPQ